MALQQGTTPIARVAVVGGVNLDIAVQGMMAPEAGETVLARSYRKGLGGKGANQAVAAARAGAAVSFFGTLAGDTEGELLRNALVAADVDISKVASSRLSPSGIAVVMVSDDGENRIVVVPGANGSTDAGYIKTVATHIASADVLVVQGEISAEATRAAIRIAEAADVRIVINLAPVVDLGPMLSLADPLIVNEIEAGQLTGIRIAGVEDVIDRAAQFGSLARSVLVTIGPAGAVLIEGTEAVHIPAPAATEVRDTTGAGDALVGVCSAALALGMDLISAVTVAVASATATVAVQGAAENYPVFDLRLRGDTVVEQS